MIHSVCDRCGEIHEVMPYHRPSLCIGVLRRELLLARRARDEARHHAREADDMRRVIADQARYIEMLEEEATPRVRRVDTVGVQEELL